MLGDGVPDVRDASAVDVVADPSAYRDRVASAVGEIAAGATTR